MPAEIVSVEDAPVLTDAGLNAAAAPAGTPEIEKLTVCAEPDVIAVEIVLPSDVPCNRLSAAGEAEMEKSFAVRGWNPLTPFGVPHPLGPS